MTRLPLLAVVLATLTGCSTALAGTASPLAGDPLTTNVGSASLTGATGEDYNLQSFAAGPDGTFAALLTTSSSSDDGLVVRLATGDGGGLEVVGTAVVPPVEQDTSVQVAPDGTVLVIGTLPDDDYRLVLARVAPGASEAEVTDLEPRSPEFIPSARETALSADGRTLFASLHYAGASGTEVVAFDVATGEVLDSAPVDLGGSFRSYAYELAARRDGGVTLLARVAYDPRDDGLARVVLAEYDAELELVGEPVVLLPDAEESVASDVRLLPGGGALAVVNDGIFDSELIRLVVVRDGAVASTIELDRLLDLAEAPANVAVDPSGRYVYVPWESPGEEAAGVATVDLTTGELVADVQLCGERRGYAREVALGADGRSVAVSGGCGGPDEFEAHAFLIR